MTLESGISFFLAIFIFGITPGPGVFAILGRALTCGVGACFPLALGMVISDIIYLVLACFGLAALAEHWGTAFMVVRGIGAIYLIYLGVKLWRAHRQLAMEGGSVIAGKSRLSFIQGFLISASNPKVILFYIAFLPTFIDLTVLTGADIVLASGLTLIGLMAGLMLIAALASSLRHYVRSETGQKTLNRTAGSAMIGAGAYLVSSS